jgi:two-component system, NarL family, response regulator
VAEAEDREIAIELLNQDVFDVVQLDVELPGIGGVEVLRQIKHCHPQLIILALVSHSQSALVARLVEAGAQGYR